MKKRFWRVFLAALLLPVFAAQAETRTVTLEVDGMTCKMCPITVKKALKKVPGVVAVEAKYEGNGEGWAQVTFDPAKASVADLTAATEWAGYPSRPKD